MAGELPVLNLCDACTPEIITVENSSSESIGGCSGKEVKTEVLECKSVNEGKEIKQDLTDDENSTLVKIISDHENSLGDFMLPTEETNISIAESLMDSGYLDEISCENDTEKLISTYKVEDKSIKMPDASVKAVLPSDLEYSPSVAEEEDDVTLSYESPKKSDPLFESNNQLELDTSELPVKKLKPALKGPHNLIGNHDKRVTFCDHLTIYSEDFPTHEKIISLEEHLSSKFYNWKLDESSGIFPELEGLFGNSFTDSSTSKSFGPTLQRWFELDADSQNTVFGAQDDDTEDFFVHKVIYDSQILQEDDSIPEMQNEECDSVVYGCHINQDECQEFIVHQVAQCESECESSSPDAGELESDLDVTEKNPSDEKSDLSPENKSDMEQSKLCKLSVENILQHDRLTEERARSDNLVSVLSKPSNSCSDTTDQLILSPPLQELGLEKLTRSQEDGTVWRLEISPLNSVQETDSDTSASSEDTMIMMTSEECERNEQHIRESFQQFECIKRGITENHKQNDVFNENPLKAPDINSEIFPTSKELDAVEKVNSLIKLSSKSLALENHPRKTSASQYSCSTEKSLSVLVSELVTSEQWPTKSDHCGSLEGIFSFSDLPVMVNHDSIYSDPESIHPSKMNSVLSLSMPDEETCKFSSSSSSHSSQSTSSRVWDSTLASVEIPHDVREWKITVNSPNDSTMQNQATLDENASSNLIQNKAFMSDNFEDDKCDIEDITSKMPCNRKILQGTPRMIHASDELEHFVQQCSERIERIRKRYSLTEEVELSLGFVRKPSVRGIRPRFGSTAEILKQMQKQLHPPLLASSGCTGSHLTWPYCNVSHPRTTSFSKSHNSTALLSDIVEEVPDSNSFNNLPPHHRHHHCSFQDITANSESSNSSPGRLLEKGSETSYMPTSYHIVNRNKDINSTMPNLISETDERGTPEGASSPKLSTDSLCQKVLHQQLPLPEEGVIYYSMKI